MNEQDGEGMIYTSGRRILVLKVTSWPLYQACRSQLRYNFTISQANLRKLFNFTPFSRRMLAHILYSGHTIRTPCHQIFPPFIHSLPTTHVSLAQNWHDGRKREGRKRKQKKIFIRTSLVITTAIPLERGALDIWQDWDLRQEWRRWWQGRDVF